MKQVLLIILLLASLVSVGVDRAAAQAGNFPLIVNGDFETDADANGVPDGWYRENTDNISLQEEAGNHFLRLKVTEPDKMILVYRAIPVRAEDKAFELSFRVRYEEIQPGRNEWFDGRIMMNFKDADGNVIKPGPPSPSFRRTSKQWQQRSIKFIVPEGAVMLEIMPCLFQAKAGTLDIDDLHLRRLGDAEAESLVAEKQAAEAKKAEQQAALEEKVDKQLADRLAATGNLIANGDFEIANKRGDWPEGWGQKADASGITWEQEGDERFMRIVSPEPGKLHMLYHMVLLPSGTRGIEISMRYRTAGIQAGSQMPGDARAVFHFLGGARTGHLEDGPRIEPAPKPIVFSPKASEWTHVSQRCLVPDSATKLQVMPGLWFAKAGTVDLAEIRITPMSQADAQAMAERIAAARRLEAERAALIERDLAMPPISTQLKVVGNQVVDVNGKVVWLQGLSVDSMQWGMGENILWSIRTAIDDWHANVIRLAVTDDFWFGRVAYQNGDAEPYRRLVDQAVQLCASRGAYLVLDLHRFGSPREAHVEFWRDAAARYKDNPAVVFELFNEPHGISWKVWRDGGNLKEDRHTDVNPTENTEKQAGDVAVGMQAMLDAIRETGAKNVVAVGGLDWAYDLTGIVNGYALQDRGGHGIIYVSHIYPWKKDWQEKVLAAAEKHPVIITEVGCIEKWSDFAFIPEKQRYPLEGWAEDMLGMIQKYRLHWTGFSFHPRCGPMIIEDWDYNPTSYWGIYVKQALAGKQFELRRMR